jgi:hypothetical protein
MNIFKFLFNPDWFTFYMGGGGSSAPTQQNVSQTTIPEYARPYVEKMLGKAEAYTDSPYQAYGGERVAGFDPMQQQAFQEAANLGPAQQLGTGTRLAGAAGLGSLQAGQNYANQATNPGAVQAYMSPYIQNALNPQMEEARRQSNITGTQNAAQAVGAGAFGGSRFGLQEAERQRNLGQNLSNIYGTGMQNAFQAANQAQQFGAQLGLQGYGQGLQAANTLGQLGQTQFGQQQQAMNARAAAGAQQQAMEQQKLTQQYQDFLTQRGYPQQQLSFMSDILRGIPLSQQTQQQFTAPQSFASQAAQLGLGAYGMTKAFGAEGGQVKTFAEGGIADAAPGSYNVPPEKLMGMMSKMSPEQLTAIGQGTKNAVTLGIVQAELNKRQMMHDGQILARSTPEGTVKDAMMGIDEAPLDDRLFADTAVGEIAPEPTDDGYAGGGILAFKKGGDKGEDYVSRLANRDVSAPVMSEEELAQAQQRGIEAKQRFMGEDKSEALMNQLNAMYGEGYTPEAKEQQKGLMALRAAAAFAPARAGEAAPTFMAGLAKAGAGVAEDVAEAKKKEQESKRLMLSAQLDFAKAKRAEKAGDYEAGQRYADSMFAKKDAAQKASLEKDKALADIDVKREGYQNQLEAARISAGPGYAAANKQSDFAQARNSFMRDQMAQWKVKNPGKEPTDAEYAAMDKKATTDAANAMKQYSGQIGQDKLDVARQDKIEDAMNKWRDSANGNRALRDAAKQDKKDGNDPTKPGSLTYELEKRKRGEYEGLFGGGQAQPAPAQQQGQQTQGQQTQAARPATREEYDKLPKGAEYIAPDGTRRVKQ